MFHYEYDYNEYLEEERNFCGYLDDDENGSAIFQVSAANATGNEEEPEQKVSILNNAGDGSLDSVYIMEEENEYRLVVIHKRKVLTEKLCKTAKGCKINFTRLYGDKFRKKCINPQWGDFW
ncbi:MAG: hypothetical protein GY950_21305 [bacterium]|nr:hypothetical protein [bacterium]